MRTLTGTRRLAILGIAAGALAAGGALAFGATSLLSSNTITACVQPRNSVLHLANARGVCPRGYTSLSWSKSNNTSGARKPSATQGPVVLYDSLTPQGVYSQAFNGPQVTQFGQAVNLAANPSGAPLKTATVRMVNYGTTAFTTSVTFNIYKLAQGGTVGSLLGSVTKTISVPAAASASWPHGVFNATFDFGSRHIVLPDNIVFGITLNNLDNSGNDSAPVGSLNVGLSPNVSTGTNVYPGDIFISSLQADTGSTALGSNLGACPGAPTDVLTTFQGVPVSCANGYAGNTESVINSSWLGVDTTPAVEFTTAG